MRLTQERWHSRCQGLQDWVTNHDGALPNCHVQLPCGFWIGPWLNKQRKKLRASRLAADLVSKLDVAAPGWRIGVTIDPDNVKTRLSPEGLQLDGASLVSFSAAADLVETPECCPPRADADSTELQLAQWTAQSLSIKARQRKCHKRAQLMEEEALLPAWQYELRWLESIAELVTFMNKFGRVPKPAEGAGKWLQRQRANHRNGKMRADRERALDAAVPNWKGSSKRPERSPVHEPNADAVSD